MTLPAKTAVVFFVYVIGCADKDGIRTYVGWTTEPDRRLAEHNAGRGARSTRGRRWRFLHLEQHASKQAAMSREWHLKRDRSFRRRLAQDLLATPRRKKHAGR
jgi:putative endonuclease